MSLECILLALLARPASGYDLRKAFDESIKHFWSADLAQIYPTLKQLERRGLLTSRRAPSCKGPPRTVYRRTPAGKKALLAWLRSGPQLGTERFAYIAQLAFLHELGDLKQTRAFLLELREKLAAWLSVLQEFNRQSESIPPAELTDEHFHHHLGLRMGLHSLAAKIAWCDESLARVDARIAEESSDD